MRQAARQHGDRKLPGRDPVTGAGWVDYPPCIPPRKRQLTRKAWLPATGNPPRTSPQPRPRSPGQAPAPRPAIRTGSAPLRTAQRQSRSRPRPPAQGSARYSRSEKSPKAHPRGRTPELALPTTVSRQASTSATMPVVAVTSVRHRIKRRLREVLVTPLPAFPANSQDPDPCANPGNSARSGGAGARHAGRSRWRI